MADGGNVIAKAYVAIIPTMEGSQKSIATQLTGVTEPASKQAGEKSGKTFGESLAKGLKTASAVIAGAMATATATVVATGKAFVNSAKDVASYGDNIDKMSQKMGISAKAYQEWDYILKRNGSSIDALKTSMKTLATASVEGNGAFKKIGITAKELKSMNQEELFEATIKGLQGVKNETLRMNLASRLLGKGATELGAVFNMTESETEGLRQKIHDLNGVMSDESVKDSANFQDQLLDMQTSMDGLKRNMMSQFLPSLSAVMTGLGKLFGGDSTGIGMISSGIQSVIGKIAQSTPQILSLVSTLLTNLTSAFLPMLPSVVSTIFSFITQAIVSITGLIPQLTPVFTEGLKSIGSALFSALPVLISALVEMGKELVTWLASGDNTKTFVTGVLQLISVIAESLASSLEVLLPAIVNIIGQCADALTEPSNVQMIISSILYIVGAVIVALVKALPEIGGLIVKTFTNLGKLLKECGSNIVSAIGPWFVSLWNDLSLKLGNLITNITGKLSALPKQAIQIGKDLIQGFIDGIGKLAKKAVDTVKSLGSKVVSGLKGILGIHSPSRVFKELGEMTGEGFRIGYQDSFADAESDVLSSMEGLTSNMTATVNANTTANPMNGSQTVYGGSISINVYGAEGQNINDLANVIAIKLEEMTRRKGAVYA